VKRSLALVAAVALFAAGCSKPAASARPEGASAKGTLKIAVLLHLSGAENRDWRPALDWAVQNVNAAGGVAGKRIELLYRDVADNKLDAETLALAKERDVVGIIGPQTSPEVFRVARTIIDSQKVFVTPSASSADVYRAFRNSPFFWRTVESDIAQTRILTDLASQHGDRKVALLTSTDQYGTTFFDWFGYYADELGLQPTGEERWDQSQGACDAHVDAALRGHPQTLIAVPSSAGTTECIVRRWRQVGAGTRLLFSDAAENPTVVASLGAVANGMEGVAPTAPPANGFDAAFRTRFGHAPTSYAANAYDAVLLLAYGLQASAGKGGLPLAEAMQRVVQPRGALAPWNAAGVAAALTSMRAGGHPDVTGAAGPLEFDDRSSTEPVASTYRHWVVRDGQFATVATVPATSRAATATPSEPSASRERAHDNVGGTETRAPRRGLWALLVAGSSGWENYRHQADVLAQYQLLRKNGVPDNHIVLVAAGDLSGAPQNPTKGVIRYEVGGPNLANNVAVDYRLSDLTARDLLDILAGRASNRLPQVINSGPDDDVYVFFAGHGNNQGFYLGSNGDIADSSTGNEIVTPDELAATAQDLSARGRYRHLLIAVEACEGGTLGTKLDAPGAALLAGADPSEDSQSIGYDAQLGTWLADEFASSLYRVASQDPSYSLAKTFTTTYLDVAGSHVSFYGPRFGNANTATIGEFFSR
jgi:ABC-type branched-subunit amino acid transport system substrate-binding protein